ncbi:DNA primase [Myxococcota bacterium]|nr:DNA primase [Myxococcota bacterium]MBU1537557.1 DNA primase [Myxococcota bacterium]
MRFSAMQLKEIRQALNLADVIGRQVSLKLSGNRLKGRCPFHDEKTPSFFVDADKGRYYCFGCGVKGDVFDYLMAMDGISFSEAVERAASEAGVDIRSIDSKEEEELRRQETRRSALYNINDRACQYFQDQLYSPRGSTAREYLTGRGISTEMWEKYRLGYAPDEWTALCNQFQSPAEYEHALEVGLIRNRRSGDGQYDFYRHRVMFPIVDTSGRIRGFSSRILDPERQEGKYVNSPESEIFKKHLALFGLYNAKNVIRKSNRAILVEGNLDVITMAQAGFEETVAPLGTAITESQIKLLTRFTKNVVLMLDGDSAGRAASLKTTEMMLSMKVGGSVVLLPPKDDPDSLLRREGVSRIEEVLRIAQPPMETLFALVLPPVSASTTEKIAALQSISHHLESLSNAERDLYAREIAIRFGMEHKMVLSVFHSFSRDHRDDFPSGGSENPSTQEVTIDPDLMALLHIAVLGFHGDSILPMDQLSAIGNSFSNSVAIDLWRIMTNLPRPVSSETWRQTLGPYYPKFMEITRSFFDEKHQIMDQGAKALREVILSLRRRGLKYRVEMLDFAILSAKKDGDKSRVEILLREKLALQKERVELAEPAA